MCHCKPLLVCGQTYNQLSDKQVFSNSSPLNFEKRKVPGDLRHDLTHECLVSTTVEKLTASIQTEEHYHAKLEITPSISN